MLLLALFPELALNLVSVPVISFITTSKLPITPLNCTRSLPLRKFFLKDIPEIKND